MAASQEKQMEVCEICGAFLIVGDAQQRIDDHLTGKQHVGFAKLRAAILEIKEASKKIKNIFIFKKYLFYYLLLFYLSNV